MRCIDIAVVMGAALGNPIYGRSMAVRTNVTTVPTAFTTKPTNGSPAFVPLAFVIKLRTNSSGIRNTDNQEHQVFYCQILNHDGSHAPVELSVYGENLTAISNLAELELTLFPLAFASWLFDLFFLVYLVKSFLNCPCFA